MDLDYDADADEDRFRSGGISSEEEVHAYIGDNVSATECDGALYHRANCVRVCVCACVCAGESFAGPPHMYSL